MPTQTPVKKELFADTLKKLFLGVFVGILGMLIFTGVNPLKTEAATTGTINFQAKLETSTGALAPDGNYNIEFNLYSVASSGTSLWHEDYLNNTSNAVRVANGYLTVNLGSATAFPSTINWDQDLYLGMTVRGTGASCAFSACTPTDAEMAPRMKLTATPYAFAAGKLSQLNGTSGFTSSLTLQGPTVGNQSFVIQDQGAAGTYNILTAPSGSDGYVKLQSGSPGAIQTGNLNINGIGIFGSSVNVPLVQTTDVTTATTNSAAITFRSGNSTTSGDTGAVSLASGNATSGNSGSLTISTGAAAGSSKTSGNISIDVGAATSSATAGTISIGTTNATAITIGRTGTTATINGPLTANGPQFTNNGSTLLTATTISPAPTLSGDIGLNTATVDIFTTFKIPVATGGLTLSLPTPTSSAPGRLAYVINTGSVPFTMSGVTVANGKAQTYVFDGSNWTATNIDGAGSGVTFVGTIDTQTKSTDGAVVSGNGIYLQTADATSGGHIGLVSTSTQSFVGQKTFTTGIVSSGGVITLQGNAASTLNTSSGGLTIDTITTAGQTIAIGNSAITHTIQIGTDATTAQTITLGSTGTGSTTVVQGGTSVVLSGAAATTYTVGATNTTGTTTIGQSTATNSILVGNAATTTAQTVTIANGSTGAGSDLVTIGSTNGASSLALQAGTGNFALTGAAGTTYTIGTSSNTGGITLGNSTAANTIAVGNAATTAAQTIQIGTGSTGAGSDLVSVGSANGASSLTERVGTGNYSLDGAAGSTYTFGASTTTGTFNLGGTAQTGATNIGRSTATNTLGIGNGATASGNTQTIQVGTAATGTGIDAITIGSTNGASSLALQAGTGNFAVTGAATTTYTIGTAATTGTITLGQASGATANSILIGNGAVTAAQTVTIGNGSTGAGSDLVTIGSTNGASSLALQAGTGNFAVTGAATTTYTIGTAANTGGITIGNSTAANTIAVGNAATTAAQTISIGTGSTGAGSDVVSIGSANGASSLTERVGTGNYSLDGAAGSTYTFGASTTTGTFNLGGTAQTGATNIGRSTATNTLGIGNGATASGNTQTIQVGTAATGTGIDAITIGSTNGASSLALQAGTGNFAVTGAATTTYTIGTAATTGTITLGQASGATANSILIGNGAVTAAQTIQLGTGSTGAGSDLVTIGSTNGASATTINAGTGNLLITGAAGATYTVGATTTTGTTTIGQSTATNTINVGNAATTAAQTVTIANGSTGAGSDLVTIGSTNGASSLALQAGTGNFAVTGAVTTTYTIGTAANTGGITIGNSTVANTIALGNAATTAAQTISVGTGSTGAGSDLITVGSTNGASSLALQAGTGNFSVSGAAATTYTIGTTTTTGNTTIGQSTANNTIFIGNGATTNTQTITIGNASTGAGKDVVTVGSTNGASSLALQAGSGGVAVTGALTVNSGLTVTNGGNVAFQKTASDYSAVGSTNNVNFGTGGYVRLTGATSQTITGIANGTNGQLLTIVNAGSNPATLKNNDTTDSSGTNVIFTGTGSDLSLPVNGSVTLIYDSGSSVWRVNGSVATTAAPGVNTVGAISATSNANGATITGTTLNLTAADGTNGGVVTNTTQSFVGQKTFTTGIVSSGGVVTLQGNVASTFNTSSGGLTIDTITTAGQTIAIGNSAITHTIQIGTDATTAQTVTLGSTGTGSTTSIQGGTSVSLSGAAATTYTIGTTGTTGTITLGQASGATANSILIGNGAVTAAQTITIGNGSTGAGSDLVTIGSINGASATTINAGTGNLLLTGAAATTYTIGATGTTGTTTIGQSTATNTIFIGNAATTNAQTITVGTGSTGAGSDLVSIGSANGASSLTERVGTGNYSLDGAASSTYTIGASTTTGTFNLGGTAQTGATNIGRSTATNTLGIGNGVTASGNTQTIQVGTAATGTGIDAITIGSTNGASSLALQAGTGNFAVTGAATTTYTIGTAATTGTITLGQASGATANSILIGNGAVTAAQTVTIGTGSTGAGSDLVTIGSTNGASSLALQAGTGNFAVTGAATTTYTIGTAANTGGITIGNSTAANTIAIGNAATTTAQTISIGNGSTGAGSDLVTIGSTNGASSTTINGGTAGVNVNGNTAITGSLATKKGSDVATTGTFTLAAGSASLIRLTGTSAQTVQGISGFSDGYRLTIVNAGTQAATLSNQSGTAANQITTGTGADDVLPVNASVELIYDATAGFWRIASGAVAATGGYVQLQGSTPGTQQTGNVNVSGTGIFGTALQSPSLDTAAGLSLGTGTATGVTVGGTTNTTSILLQGAAAATYTIGTANNTGGITIGNSTAVNTVAIGNAATTVAQTIAIGTGSTGAGSDLVTVGSSNGASSLSLQGGTGGINIGTGGAVNTINIGNTTGGVAQTVNLGTNGTGSSSETINIGSTIGGATTLQSAGGVTVNKALTLGTGAGTSGLTNNGSTLNSTLAINNGTGVFGTGAAATTVDVYTSFSIVATGTGLTYTPPTPTSAGAYGHIIYVSNIGTNSFTLVTSTLRAGATATLVWENTNGAASWTFAGADNSSISNQVTTQAANFNVQAAASGSVAGVLQANAAGTGDILDLLNGAGATVGSFSSTGAALIKTSTNSTTAFQVQNSNGTPIFLVDTSTNQSGNYLTNGGFENGTVGALPTGWSTVGTGTVTAVKNVTAPNHYGGLASALVTTSGVSGQGISTNTFSPTPPSSTQVTVSFYAESVSGITASASFSASFNGGAATACTSGTTLVTTGFQRITCTLTTPAGAVTSMAITQNVATASSYYVDAVQLVTGSSATPASAAGGIQLRGAVDAPVVFQALSNSTTAFQIQNTAGTSNLFVADTLNGKINVGGTLDVGNSAGSGAIVNNGTTTNTTLAITNGTGTFGANTATVDLYTSFAINSTASGQAFTVPNPTNTAAYGRVIYISNVGATNSFTLDGSPIRAGATATLVWENFGSPGAWTFAGADNSSILNQTSQQTGANFNIDGTGTAGTFASNNLVAATAGALNIGTTATATSILIGSSNSTGNTIQASGSTDIQSTTDNSQAFAVSNSAGADVFNVDTTNSATGLNIVNNGGAETGSPPTGWSAQGTGASILTGTGADVAGGVQSVKTTFGTTSLSGVKDTFTTAPTASATLNYVVSFSIKQLSGTTLLPTNLEVQYSANNGTTLVTCSTLDIPTTGLVASTWTKISCVFIPGTTTVTTALVYIRLATGVGTSVVADIDNLSVVQQNTTGVQNGAVVSIGGETSQGLTLFQLDTYAANPFLGSSNGGVAIPALAGAMYFDTTAGKMQCYDGSNWGACGAAANTIVTLTPEYAGAVLDGSSNGSTPGVGTLTSDFCASSTPLTVGTLCASGDARNFYKWTSPQATSQTYYIYVTYKLPSSFKAFVPGSTSVTGLVSSTANPTGATASGTVGYAVFNSTGGTITQCSAMETVVGWTGSSSFGTANTWTTGVAGNGTSLPGSTDPASGGANCTYAAGSNIIFQIQVTANANAAAYPENINFQFSNK